MTEEEKKFLELLRYLGEKNVGKRGNPPHIESFENLYLEDIFAKAADLIESLSAQLDQVTRERDAAVNCLSENRRCETCKHYSPGYFCMGCRRGDKWQWRGVEVEG